MNTEKLCNEAKTPALNKGAVMHSPQCPNCFGTGCQCGGIGLDCHGCCDCEAGDRARLNRKIALAEIVVLCGGA
jgi:hypothetical protein